MVKANVDRILEYLKTKNSATTGELAKKLSLPKGDVEKSAEYLEEDGVVKIEHKFPNTYVTLVKEKPKEDDSGELPPPPKPDEGQEQSQPNQQAEQPPNQPSFLKPEQPQPIQQPQQPEKTSEILTQEPQTQQSTSPVQNLSPQPDNDLNTKQEEFPFNPPDQEKQTQTNSQDQTKQTLQQPPVQQQQNYPFLTAEPEEKKQENENVLQSPAVTEEPQATDSYSGEEDPMDPSAPKFEMNAPPPESETNFSQDTYEEQKVSKREEKFPDYAESPVDKIEFMVNEINNKLEEHDYKNINVMYKKLYDMYQEENLSPNERYIVGEKIEELFQRVKRIYLIEGVAL
jgi:hypothetical protein